MEEKLFLYTKCLVLFWMFVVHYNTSFLQKNIKLSREVYYASCLIDEETEIDIR